MPGYNRRGTSCECCMLRKMKTIPARFLPTGVKKELSVVLDPRRDLGDSDYRFFAERNNLTPEKWQWLDSQKTEFCTSSIIKVLDYLVDQQGDQFTVYKVYKTLCDMKSRGQTVITERMPEILMMYNQGTRPGQENSEPPSLSLGPRDGQRVQQPPPPPSYNPSPLQYYCGGESPVALNDLNDPPRRGDDSGGSCPPEKSYGDDRLQRKTAKISNSQSCVKATCGSSTLPMGCDHQSVVNRPVASPCENSYDSSCGCVHDNMPEGRGDATENSFHSIDNNESALAPPSYAESELQYRRLRELPQSSTQMDNLKLPLQGPVISADTGDFSGPDTSSTGSACLQGHFAGDHKAISVSPIQEKPKSQILARPLSYPEYQPSDTCRSQVSSSRPLSDAVFCSHSAQHCHRGDAEFLLPSEPLSEGVSTIRCYLHTHVGSGQPVSGLSGQGIPWNEERHQTEVKRPLTSEVERRVQPQLHSLPPHFDNTRERGLSRHLSVPAQLSDRNGSSLKFVFVMVGDMEETDRLDRQVAFLCRRLEENGVGYVVYRSTDSNPLVWLHSEIKDHLPPLKKDFKSIQEFVWKALKKASKVLMLITPGYLRYADAYTKGAEEVTSLQQKFMRKIQESLKKEFFAKKHSFRIWPILLQELKANRLHIPSFLSSASFFWFPCTSPEVEDVMKVLKKDLDEPRLSGVKRSF